MIRSAPVIARSLAGSLLLTALATPSYAATFTGAPLFTEVNQYSTLVEDDPADIYYPINAQVVTPVVLLLQGALVDKADYSNYAQIVAAYGFTVVVPNNVRSLSVPGLPPFTGLFPEQGQVEAVLDFAKQENADSQSPVAGLLDTDTLGLLGHSFGGAVGLAAVQGGCFFILCTDSYDLPEALKAGIFYGANFDAAQTGTIPPLDNQTPTGLILGTRDGVAPPADTVTTFEQLLNPPKVLVSVEGANHYSITNTDSFRDPVRPTLDQAVATETIGRWSGAFLRAHLLEDDSAWDYIYTSRGDNLDENVAVEAVSTPEPSVGLLSALLLGPLGFLGRRLWNKG
ncbi:MAG: chlorophyllase [Cyanobacteria bacterium P01_H01_bin.119]